MTAAHSVIGVHDCLITAVATEHHHSPSLSAYSSSSPGTSSTKLLFKDHGDDSVVLDYKESSTSGKALSPSFSWSNGRKQTWRNVNGSGSSWPMKYARTARCLLMRGLIPIWLVLSFVLLGHFTRRLYLVEHEQQLPQRPRRTRLNLPQHHPQLEHPPTLATSPAALLSLSSLVSSLDAFGNQNVPVSFPVRLTNQPHSQFAQLLLPPPLPDNWIYALQQLTHPDYGPLIFESSSAFGAPRRIRTNDLEIIHAERFAYLNYLDETTPPGDVHREDPGRYDHYEELDYPQRCHRLKWSYDIRPTCQAFHEFSLERPQSPTSLQEWDYTYLGSGNYRDTWKFVQTSPQSKLDNRAPPQQMVIKTLRLNERRNFTAFEFQQVQLEAMAMQKTTSSQRTFDIYGHCGTSVMVQAGTSLEKYILPFDYPDAYDDRYGQARMDIIQKDDVYPMNVLTPEQKLYIALAMAESLAVLHGHEEGLIVNDDIQVAQFLVAADDNTGRLQLRLNDFNNARIPKWKFDEPRYCSFVSIYEWTNRSPEEITGDWADEKVDVFALGNVFYSVLTGLPPYYNYPTIDEAISAISSGKTPYLDSRWRNRSLIEGRLVEIMEPMWKFHREDRINIFEVVKHLRETVTMHAATGNGNKDETALLTELLAKGKENATFPFKAFLAFNDHIDWYVWKNNKPKPEYRETEQR